MPRTPESGGGGGAVTTLRGPGPAAHAHPVDHRIGLILTQVAADPDISGPIAGRGFGSHLAKAVQGASGPPLQVMRVWRQAQHPAPCGQCSQHRAGFVAPGRMPPIRVGVAEGDRTGGQIDGLQGGLFRRMAHVDDQSDAVHFGHGLPAKPGQARIGCFMTSGREQGLVVVA